MVNIVHNNLTDPHIIYDTNLVRYGLTNEATRIITYRWRRDPKCDKQLWNVKNNRITTCHFYPITKW